MFAPQPVLPDEDAIRLDCLAARGLDETALEPLYDQLAALGASLFGVPVCMVSIMGQEDQAFIGRFGMEIASTPRALSFCHETLAGDRMYVVPDLADRVDFASNPFVHGPGVMRFYAGTPLHDVGGVPIGSFCIMDHRPHPTFSDDARAHLAHLASIATGSRSGTRRRRPCSAMARQRRSAATSPLSCRNGFAMHIAAASRVWWRAAHRHGPARRSRFGRCTAMDANSRSS